MASTATISRVVRTLCEAHGRKPSEETFDAYKIALDLYTDAEVDAGLVTSLREQREFMPPPGIVAGFAKDARNARIRRQNNPDERRLICALCQDCGHVSIVNRNWLREHRDQFSEEWFVKGWMRQAAAWCLVHAEGLPSGRGAFLWEACCFCDCPLAKGFRAQAQRFVQAMNNSDFDERKTPALGFLFDRDLDCMVTSPSASKVQAAILEWTVSDREGRTWSGNWEP